MCYNDHDSKWVINEMLPRLEGSENHLKLCLHKRDLLVRRDIVDNIVESMEDNRKTVIIMIMVTVMMRIKRICFVSMVSLGANHGSDTTLS